jgi:mannose-6-phosphate isomerase
MSEIFPFRLAPYFRTRIWGFHDLAPWFDYKTDGEPIGEVWLTGEMCKVATGPFTGQTLRTITDSYGPDLLGSALGDGEFPLLIKMLFPKEKLSVQVHPDDAMARKYGEPRGKTECWYALDAEPGATVALGTRPGVTIDEIRAAINASTLENLLEMVPVQKSDMLFVDAGTVHAMGPGVVILETQQTSDLTYRMYDYGRPRELHLEKSLEALRLTTRGGKIPPHTVNGHSLLIDERYFEIERWDLPAGEAPAGLSVNTGAVQILFVASGSICISADAGENIQVERCQLAVIPALTSGVRIGVESPAEVIRVLPKAV